MTPILYEANETTFSNNGICRLRDCISCVVTEERNGVFECDFDYPITGANFEEIICGRIISVKHDDTDDAQPFDIISYSKPINGVVTFHAVHISYRQNGMTVAGKDINSLAAAFDLLKTAEPENPFEYEADFTSSAYMAAADGTPRSVRQMLGGIEGSVLDTYGGEFEWDKFNVKLRRNRGTLTDFVIRYGVNMLDYNEDVDFSSSFTSCVPYWVGDDGNGGTQIIKGARVVSGLSPYDGRDKCVPLDLTSKFETAPTAEQLETLALSKMTGEGVNLPTQNIKVDFVRLQDFEEYKQFASLLQCQLCDTIRVEFPDYETSGLFKIVKTEYDALAERFSSMELGTLSTTLSEALGIGETLNAAQSGGGSAIRYGVCENGAGTVAKTVTVSPALESLATGDLIFVKFNNYNTATNPTLNVNGLGAHAIKRYGSTAPGTSAAASWNAGSTVALVYDGSYWQIVGWINTTYSGMTDAEYKAGTSTANRLITPARLKAAIQLWGIPADKIVTGSYVYSGSSATQFAFSDPNVNGKSFIICGTQDSGNPVLRATINGSVVGVYLADPVTIMRVNYICF